MKSWRLKNRSLATCFIVCSTALVIACAGPQFASYPTDFASLDNEKVHSAMKNMHSSINKLEQVLNEEGSNETICNQCVVAELNSLMQATKHLGHQAVFSNHRSITDNIDRFRSQIRSAKIDAQKNPPEYAEANQLVTGCLNCHAKSFSEWDAF